jgi:hypothetical protein
VAVDSRGHAVGRLLAGVVGRTHRQTAVPRGAEYRFGEDMGGVLLGGRGQRQQFVRIESVVGANVHQFGVALGEGAGLVERGRPGPGELLENAAALHDHAGSRGA